MILLYWEGDLSKSWFASNMMDKERLSKTDGGYSEKEMDKASDRVGNVSQVKAKSIFDPKKKKGVILDLQS